MQHVVGSLRLTPKAGQVLSANPSGGTGLHTGSLGWTWIRELAVRWDTILGFLPPLRLN